MDTVTPVLVLFFLMLTGFVCAKVKVTSHEVAGHFSSFIINITLPALLFVSFQRPFSSELLREAALAFGLSVLVYGLSIFIAVIYPKILNMKGPERGVHRYAIVISNSGFIGYPMVEAFLGPAFLFHAVIFNIPYSFLAFSICAWFISKEGKYSLKMNLKTFLNPNVIATFLGLLFFLFSIKLPDFLYRCFKMTGDMTSPLSMIVIGTTLAQANLKQVFGRWRIYVTVLMRLLILPLIVGVIFYLLGIRGQIFLLGILITAMPVGSSTSILSSLYSVTPQEASSLVFMSTTLCMVTVPLVVFFANMFA